MSLLGDSSMTLNEREAFESWFKGTSYFQEILNDFGGETDTFRMEDNDKYYYCDVELSWRGWLGAKAQAVPEGYCLVPKEPTEKMFQAYARYSVAPMSTLSKTGYKAMIEASEPGAEG